MVAKYPYKLYKFTTTGATQDENGDWIEGSSEWVLVGKCRDEQNNNGSKVSLSDQEAYLFDSVIFMPKSVESVEVGTKIKVVNGDTVRFESICKRFQKDQMHARLWV